MRRFAPIFLASALWAADGPGQVQAVYIMPMASGMDQYLAHRLTSEAVYPVVTDPKLADAVFTDQIGASFERRLTELYPPPPPPPAPEPDPKAEKSKKEKEDEDAKLREELRRESNARPVSQFQRGQGNIFLVDLKSRRVLWSTHDRPKNFHPIEMERTSGRITMKLRKDLGRK